MRKTWWIPPSFGVSGVELGSLADQEGGLSVAFLEFHVGD